MGRAVRGLGLWIALLIALQQPAHAPGAVAQATAPTLLRMPYVQSTTSTSTVLAWVTDSPDPAEVRYSLDQSYTSVVAATTEIIDGSYSHHAALTGLTLGPPYHYRVYQAGADLTPWPDVTFTTAVDRGDPYFAFAALGDSRDGRPEAYQVHEQMRLWDVDLVLHTGDLVSEGSYDRFQREVFDVYADTIRSVPLYPARGNHDLGAAYRDVFYLPENAWRPADRELYYSFDWGHAHFVSVDVYSGLNEITPGIPDRDMQEWLVADLARSGQFWKVVFFHLPAYSSGAHGSSAEIRDKLVRVCEEAGVDVILAGHDHDYERTIPILNDAPSTLQEGGIVHFVTGGGGAPLRGVGSSWFTAHARSAYHFIVADVARCALTLQAVDTEGTVFDSLTIDRCTYTAALSLDVEGPAAARVGETLAYSLTVTNDNALGDGSPVQNVALLAGVSGTETPAVPAAYAGGDDGDGRLELGESWVYTASYTVQPADPNPLILIADATGRDTAGADALTARGSHDTAIDYSPALRLAVEGPPRAYVGRTAVYSLTATNDAVLGDGSPIYGLSVVDVVTGTVTQPVAAAYAGGDDGDARLEAGESWRYWASYTLQPTDPDPLVNTAFVTGIDGDGEPVPEARASHSTAVDYVPVLAIAKQGPARADVGESLVYTLTVSHDPALSTGAPVQNVSVVDDVAGVAALQRGDDGDGLLEWDEAWVYTAAYTVQPTDLDPLVNTALVTGQDLSGVDALAARDSHSTAIDYHPGLRLAVEGPSRARVGEGVVYRLTVTHDLREADGSPIHGLSVVDDVAGAAAYDGGDDGDGLLEPDEAWVYTARHTIQETDPDPLVNTARVSGRDQDGDLLSQAIAVHSTAIDDRPALALSKDGPLVARVGDTVVYTLTVTNDPVHGDGSPVRDLVLRDDLVDAVTYFGGDDGDAQLAVGEAWVYTARYTIQESDPDPLTNVARVSGVDRDGEAVPEASDHHLLVTGERVYLFLPLISRGPG